MKVASLICIALILCVELSNASQMRKFRQHISKHRLRFSSPQQEAIAFENFAKQDDFIEEHNAEAAQGKHSFELEHTKFSTMSTEERLAYTGHVESTVAFKSASKRDPTLSKQVINYRTQSGAIVQVTDFLYSSAPTDNQTLPASFDWRNYGWNTTARDQGQCGSCWTFAAAATLEAQYKIWKNTSVVLSTQHLVDCDSNDFGCNGGFNIFAQNYLLNGIVAESAYPYKSVAAGSCPATLSTATLYKSATFFQVKSDYKSLISAIVNVGPVVISVDVGTNNMLGSLKKGEIFTMPSCNTNHAVVAVGYGLDAATGKNYIIVRNSWGTSWGENGHFKMFFPTTCNLNSWAVPSVRPIA